MLGLRTLAVLALVSAVYSGWTALARHREDQARETAAANMRSPRRDEA